MADVSSCLPGPKRSMDKSASNGGVSMRLRQGSFVGETRVLVLAAPHCGEGMN